MSKSTAVVKRLDETKAEDRQQLIQVLQSSLYPGASPQSVGMVIDYCHAGGLDPMQKPVHIVPMRVKDPQSGEYGWRDVIMPGIGLYRIQADRSGSLAGMSSPRFGPDMTRSFEDKNGNTVEVSYPEWCEVTAYKLLPGEKIAEFTAREYWIENYATDSGKSNAPNAMWRKRPRGQIAKCAEAQALRKGWPEVGQAPTAEEMEGKSYDDVRESARFHEGPGQTIDAEPEVLPTYPDDKFEANLPKWRGAIEAGKKTPEDIINTVETKYTLTDEQKAKIRGENA